MFDRDLQFAIAAIRRGFLTRAQALEGIRRWAENPQSAIVQIYSDLGFLDGTQVKQLESPAAGDPSVTIEQSGKQQSEDQASARASLDSTQQTVSMVPSGSRSGDLGSELRNVAGESRGVRFERIRNHAQGGLGVVSVAMDRELGREVALKEIHDRYADHPESRRRFFKEAQITGNLEHPGIVPIYGLGSDAVGRPYYAMRFIEGQTLKEAVDALCNGKEGHPSLAADSFQLRKILGRFVDVCQAIDFAHSKGVIHRDLKPSNIMLGRFGETLVVDWGLAKQVGEPDEESGSVHLVADQDTHRSIETEDGAIVGTPSFMSPEQATGSASRIGPASDIYSLGATLYYILTGAPPIPSDEVSSMLDRVKSGKITPPRDKNRHIPAALDSICRRAMSLEQEDRYESSGELANEIERWLADEPVVAHRESFAARAARWQRKHRALASSLGVALAGVLLGAVVLIGVVSQHNRELSKQNREIQENLNLARQAIDRLMVAGNDERLKRAGLESFQSALLEAAGSFYDRILDEETNDVDVSIQRGKAEARLGNLYLAVGDLDRAQTKHELALSLFLQLTQSEQSNVELWDALAVEYNNLGLLRSARGDFENAAFAFQDAIDIRRQHLLGSGDVASQRLKIAETQSNLADLYYTMGEYEKSEEFYRTGIEQAELLLDEPSLGEHALKLLVVFLANYGEFVQSVRGNSDAHEIIERTRKLVNDIDIDPIDQPDIANVIALGWHNNSINLRDEGDWEGALEESQKAQRVFDELTRFYPRGKDYLNSQASCYSFQGELLAEYGQARIEELRTAFETALEIRSRLVQIDPAQIRCQVDEIDEILEKARALEEVGIMDEAVVEFDRARNKSRQLYLEHPDHVAVAVVFGRVQNDSGPALVANARIEEALEGYRDAQASMQFAIDRQPNFDVYKKYLANIRSSIGDALGKQGKLEEAAVEWRASLELRQTLYESRPDSATLARDVGRSYMDLGGYQSQTGQPREGLAIRQTSLEWYEKAHELDPRDVEIEAERGTAFYNASVITIQLNEAELTVQMLQGAAEIWDRLNREHSLATSFQARLANAWFHLGKYQYALGDLTATERSWRNASEQWDRLPRAIQEASGFGNLGVESKTNLGILLKSVGRTEEATDYFSQAAEAWTEINQVKPNQLTLVYEGRSYLNLAELHRENELDGEAIRYIESGLAALRRATTEYETVNEDAKNLQLIGFTTKARLLAEGRAWQEEYDRLLVAREKRLDECRSDYLAALEVAELGFQELYVLKHRLITFAKAGEFKSAAEHAAELITYDELEAVDYLDIARAYVHCANAALNAEDLAQEERERMQSDYLKKAIEALQVGAQKHPSQIEAIRQTIEEDPGLKILLEHEDFEL